MEATPGLSQRVRTTAIAAALLLFVSATVITLFQRPWSKLYEEPTGLNWILYPRNPPAELSRIDAHLRTVWALPDNEHIWAGGDLATLVYSKDGGESWTRQTLPAQPQSIPTATKPAAGITPAANAPPGRAKGSAGSGAGSPTSTAGTNIMVRAVVTVIAATPTSGSGASGTNSTSDPPAPRAFILPSQIRAGETVRATIHCQNFLLDPNLPILPGDDKGPLKLGAVEILDETSVVLNVTVDAKAEPGPYTILLGGQRIDMKNAVNTPRATGSTGPVTPKTPPANPKFAPAPPLATDVNAGAPAITTVRFRDEKYGKLITSFGFVYHTENGGTDWTPDGPDGFGEYPSCLTSDLRSLSAQSDVDAVQCTADGMAVLLRLPDRIEKRGADGKSPPASKPFDKTYGGLAPKRKGGGDANGEELAAAATRAMVLNSPPAPFPNQSTAIFVPDTGFAWAATANGSLFRGSVNGSFPAWTGPIAKTLPHINGLFFQPDERKGWAVGSSGAILRTADGGVSWSALTRKADAERRAGYSAGPAPWYVGSLILSALLFGIALLPYGPERVPQPAIEVVAASDRPLEDGRDPDPLSFRPIARGLAYFIRNPRTSPPLNFAITGEWGTGKTSLMRLLRSELRDHDFRPVWFNAWHHQKEKYLLPSLLETIRQEAVPKLWHRGGLGFRFRLLRSRWQWWFAVLALAFASTFVFTAAPALGPMLASTRPAAGTEQKTEDPFKRFGPAGAALISGFALLATLKKWLSAFGVEPAALLAASGTGTRVADLEKQTSFRYRFSKEFGEVTKALSARKMVIFIDDLDRCQQENTLDVLEAVNFLGSSGDCFVVMGMAKQVVQEYVAESLRGVSKALNASRKGDVLARTPAELASEYLQKMINIEVPVPKADAKKMRELVESLGKTAETSDESMRRGILSWVHAFAQVLIPVVVAGLLAWGGIKAGRRFDTQPPTAQTGSSQPDLSTKVVAPAAPPNKPADSVPAPKPPAANPTAGEGPESGAIYPARSGSEWLHNWPALIVIVLMIWAIYRVVTERPDLEPHDSNEFARAMDQVLPIVTRRADTPRAVKRFVNKVRYLAMCRRQFQSDDRPLWSRLWEEKTAEPSPPAATELNMPDGPLVVLAALDYWKASTLDSDEMLRSALEEWKTLEDPLPDFSTLVGHREAGRRLLTRTSVN